MSKQTAVEWLVEQFEESHSYINEIFKETIEQAKAMERWQIEQAYDRGHHDCFHGRHGKHKEYYNETYKGGEK